jgi:hypothetical protein
VKGRLAKVLEISDCNGESGMTCRIQFKADAVLPSRILVQELDVRNQPAGKRKFLPYPDLRPGEKGWASFPVHGTTLVLTGEWQGPWRDAY